MMLVFFALSLFSTPIAAQQNDDNQDSWKLDYYGQINRGILFHNDGGGVLVYPFVDNSKSSSRLGITLDRDLDSGWHAQVRGEIGLYWKSTQRVNQLNRDDASYKFDKTSLRQLDLVLQHEQIGTYFIGQGPMASDGVTSQDLSLTTVVAGAGVRNMASAMFFRETDGDLSNIRIVSRFRNFGSSRRLRFRYLSPTKNDVNFSFAVGKEVLIDQDGRYYADVAAHYDATKGDFRYKAAAAIRYAGGNPDTQYRERELSFIASGTVLHRPSRWNLTIASGVNIEASYYVYSKIGRRWYNLLPFGWTAASVDYYHLRDNEVAGAKGDSVGLAVVQKFKKQNLDVYASLRQYVYDDDAADYFDSLSFLAGVRWQF